MIEVYLDAPDGVPGADRIVAAVRAALAARAVARAELSVALVDDVAIRALNRDHLGHDRPTDVLAFALWSEGDPVVVGDVYIGVEQALRQAADAGVPPAEEVVRLAVHGTLHVSGMDHPEPAEHRAASPMYRLQEQLVEALARDPAPFAPGADACAD